MKAATGREAYFAIDAEQQVVMWAPAAEAMLGFQAKEALGRPCWEVMSGGDVFGRPLYCDQCRACLRAGGPVAPPAHHFLIRHRDGRLVRLVHELVPLPSGPGARALVFLGESSAHAMGSEDALVPGGPPVALGSFANIIRGLAALGLVADSLPSASFYQTLDSALDRALGLTGGETAEVFLWNRATREMCLTAHRGLFRSAFRQISRFGSGQGYPGLVAATAQPLITHDLLQDSRYLRTRVKEKGVRFYMSVPLLAARGVIGCLNIASRNMDGADETMLQLLSWLAAPLSTASELALLRSQENVGMLEEEDTPASGLPVQILKVMMEASEADQGLLTLWGPDFGADDTAHLIVRYQQGTPHVTPCPREGNSRPCPAYRQGRPVVYADSESLGRPSCRESLANARAAICVPLTAGGQVLGVASLRFVRPQPVPTRPLALLGAIAPRAGRSLLAAWPDLAKERAREALAGFEPEAGWAQPRSAGACPPLVPRDGRVPSGDKRGTSPRATDPTAPGYPAKPDGGSSRAVLERQPAFDRGPQAGAKSTPVELQQATEVPFLDIRCFGSFRVLRDGKPLSPASFGRRQSFTILKTLVTRRGRPVSTDFLTEVLWPDDDPEAASKRLWVVIHSLRMGLEPDLGSGQASHFVQRNGDSYSFNPQVPYRIDAQEFLKGAARGERLEIEGDLKSAAEVYQEAARLYVGDFLEEEAYSDWCSAEREYLREVFLSLLKRLASLHAGWEDWDRSIYWHRRALLVDGLREEVHRELMRCLWKAGRRDEALRQYVECKQILARELGVDPLPETEQLYREVASATWAG